jgi:hypothetical protein
MKIYTSGSPIVEGAVEGAIFALVVKWPISRLRVSQVNLSSLGAKMR